MKSMIHTEVGMAASMVHVTRCMDVMHIKVIPAVAQPYIPIVQTDTKVHVYQKSAKYLLVIYIYTRI